MIALFGGQGCDPFGELQSLLRRCPKAVVFADAVQGQFERLSNIRNVWPSYQGIIHHVTNQTEEDDEAVHILNWAVVCLGQLTLYYMHVFVHPFGMQQRWSCAIGHSQGVLAALAISSSVDYESLVEHSARAVAMAFWVGLHYQNVAPLYTASTGVVAAAACEGIQASPMLRVSGVARQQVDTLVDFINANGSEKLQTEWQNTPVCVSLVNAADMHVLSGHANTLFAVGRYVRWLGSVCGLEGSDWEGASTDFLRTDAPYHARGGACAAMPERVLQSWAQCGLSWPPGSLRFPVYSPTDGSDLGSVKELDHDLCLALTTDMVNWPQVLQAVGNDSIIDFGPGGSKGIGYLTAKQRPDCQVFVALGGPAGGCAEVAPVASLSRAPATLDPASTTTTPTSTATPTSINPTVSADRTPETDGPPSPVQLKGGWLDLGGAGFIAEDHLVIAGTGLTPWTHVFCNTIENEIVARVPGVRAGFVAVTALPCGVSGAEGLGVFFSADIGCDRAKMADQIRGVVSDCSKGLVPSAVEHVPWYAFHKGPGGTPHRRQFRDKWQEGHPANGAPSLPETGSPSKRQLLQPSTSPTVISPTISSEASKSIGEDILQLVRKIFGRDLDPGDSFSKAGMGSMTVVQLRCLLRARFGLPLTIQDVVSADSVQGLMGWHSGAFKRKGENTQCTTPLSNTKGFPATFAIPLSQLSQCPEQHARKTLAGAEPHPIALLGDGGHAACVKAILDIVPGAVYQGAYVMNQQSLVLGQQSGTLATGVEADIPPNAVLFPAIGANRHRLAMSLRHAGRIFCTIVHPTAIIDSETLALLGPGTLISEGAVIQPRVRIGAHCLIGPNVFVGHDSLIQDYTFVAGGATLGGNVQIQKGAFVGLNATINPCITIGAGASVSSGSMVAVHVEEGDTVVGVPAVSLNNLGA